VTPTPGSLDLLVLGSHYPPHSLGGYELICRDCVAWLRSRGHRVTVLTSTYGVRPRHCSESIGDAGERVVRALDFHWADFEHRRPTGLALWEGEWRQCRALRRVIATSRPQAALVWHMAGISKSLLAVLDQAGLPVVVVLGEPWPVWDIDSDHWLKLWSPRRPLARLLRPVAARAVAPVALTPALEAALPLCASDWLRRTVEAAVPAWSGRARVVRNGIHLDVMRRERPLTEPFARPVRLLYAGRVERRKGVHTAVATVAELMRHSVEAELTVAGWRDQAYVTELRGLARELHVEARVDLRDPVPREKLPDLYRASDVLLFPTIWEEPFGLVLLEAMAAGCVVVATGTGGSGEHLRHGENALLFPPEDAAAAAQCIVDLCGDPALVARLREAGGLTAQAHSFATYAGSIEEAVHDAIRGGAT